MSQKRWQCGGAMLNSQFFALGGQFDHTCEALCNIGLETQQWHSVASLPFSDMWCQGVEAEGLLFVFGKANAAVFNPRLDQWMSCPPLPGRCISLCTACVPNATVVS